MHKMLDYENLVEFEVHYNYGFGDRPRHVFAHDVEEAKRMGLAEFRKNTGSVETVDFFPLEDVVKSAVPVID